MLKVTPDPRVIEVSAEGYVSERRTVTFDRDQELLMQLEPIPGKPGMFKSEVQMIPHFKLKGVEIALTMVGQFDPPPA